MHAARSRASRAGGVSQNRQATGSGRRALGFSLVELVVVILILGILAAVAVPKLMRKTREAQVTAVVRDLQMAYDAFERYYIEHGEWPEDVYSGNFPPEMKGYLDPKMFTQRNSLGGYYDWNRGYGATAAISIKMEPVDIELFREIDQRLDDGNLNKGNVKRQSSYHLNYIIRP
ncbi:MAG: prepilin-type N-terminal cleavage/methylation domain-containing protein [Planctomycetales bacterium]|nr:prepilin-type N-terminal cleavage/methylation domain-containing protein [Planctomycetales bacterium]